MQVPSPIRLTCGSLRVTGEFIVPPKSGGTYSDALLRMTLLYLWMDCSGTGRVEGGATPTSANSGQMWGTRICAVREREMQIHSPIRLACGSLRLTAEFIVPPKSGGTYSDALLRMTVLFLWMDCSGTGRVEGGATPTSANSGQMWGTRLAANR
jgi:hypothetical protein